MISEDQLWKSIIEDLVADFILLTFPDARKNVNFEQRPEFLDKELPQEYVTEGKAPSTKIVDKLIKVFTLDGDYMIMHVEVQNKYSPGFGSRMTTYFCRIRDTHQKPVTALIIFTENIKKERPNFYEVEHMGTCLSYRFNTYKVSDHSEEELAKHMNPFALVITAAKLKGEGKRIGDPIGHDLSLMKKKLNLIRQLKKRNLDPKKELILFEFINKYIYLEYDENKLKFDNEVDKLTGIRNNMGIIELIVSDAKQDGVLEGKIAVAIELIKEGISLELIAKFTKLTLKEIEELVIIK